MTVDEETLTFGASSASARRGSVLEKGAGVALPLTLLRALHASGRGEGSGGDLSRCCDEGHDGRCTPTTR